MTDPLARGLYERLVTRLIDEQLNDPRLQGIPELDDIRDAEAADRIALLTVARSGCAG